MPTPMENTGSELKQPDRPKLRLADAFALEMQSSRCCSGALRFLLSAGSALEASLIQMRYTRAPAHEWRPCAMNGGRADRQLRPQFILPPPYG